MSVKVALVTGAAAGIGAACAKRLAQDGMAVGVLDLDEARCADTVKAIKDAGGMAIALGADVSNREQAFAAVAKLRAEFGPVTVLVNNAGVTDFTPFEEIEDDRWDFVYAVNVRGPMIMAQAVIGDMKAAHWGRIVNISSSSAQTGAVGMITYSSSKGAVVTMTRSMAQEFGPLWHHRQQHPAGIGDGHDHVRSQSRPLPDPDRGVARHHPGAAAGRSQRYSARLFVSVFGGRKLCDGSDAGGERRTGGELSLA